MAVKESSSAASSPKSAPLVSTAWLADRLGAPDLRVVDASWYLPAMNRDGKAEFGQGHIPGAIFFDLDEISDRSSDLPHMLPDPAGFETAIAALGVGDDDEIVVYDGAGLFSAPRVWWMLRIFGAPNVHVLDGGLPKWKAEGRPLEHGKPSPAPARFSARFDKAAVVGMADVAQALDGRSAQVLDMRAAGRFAGEAPEPRPNLPSGPCPARSICRRTI
ncbi:MAG: 3-mercaptopyruvate sulfurtransferase [Hyphomicrobiales bacterium]|nr:3-mercaptopyruvate sulfurtransferase [Hyphomicrobiales bacterium]